MFDTNVVLDVLLNRQPFAKDAIDLFCAVEQSAMEGVLCATTITTIDYLCTKTIGRLAAKNAINGLLALFAIAEVNQNVLEAAISSEFEDFEDAVLYYSGLGQNVEGFVTRNAKDFGLSELPVYCPDGLCSVLHTQKPSK